MLYNTFGKFGIFKKKVFLGSVVVLGLGIAGWSLFKHGRNDNHKFK
jgi:hypothetical protein